MTAAPERFRVIGGRVAHVAVEVRKRWGTPEALIAACGRAEAYRWVHLIDDPGFPTCKACVRAQEKAAKS